jgi:endoglycosylceramidase
LAGVALCSMLFVVAPAQALPPLGHVGRWLTDPQGRVVIVRGLQEWGPNGPLPGPLPFGHQAPATLGYDTDDARFMASNGFNAMRLSLSYWEYGPGRYDDSYLDGFATFVRQLDGAGVYSLIDVQQAVYGPHFSGGEGFPEWMTQTDGVPPVDAGYPNSYLVNPAENRAWDNFWANHPGPDGVGLQDHVAQGWRHLAERFADISGILGYDLLNEPWPGTPWASCASPTGCPPGGFDQTNLSSFVARVVNAVRQVDRTRLLVYEPNLEFDFGSGTQLTPPGDANAVFGFHNYCLPGTTFPGGSDSGSCATLEDQVFQNALAFAGRSGDGLLLGEWGGTSGPTDTARLADQADRYLLPWVNWWYGAVVHDPRLPPTGGNVDTNRLKLLVRPYPQRTAGTPTAWTYDRATGQFSFDYDTRAPLGRSTGSAPTEIFVPRLQYPHGYRLTVSGARAISAPTSGLARVCNLPGARTVSVRIDPDVNASTDPVPLPDAAAPQCPAMSPAGPGSTSSSPGGGVELRLPSTAQCLSRRHFTIHFTQRRAARIIRAAIFLGGRRIAVRLGSRLHAAINLRGLPAGQFRVRIAVRFRQHGHIHTLRTTRTYHTCKRGSRRRR